MSVWESYKRYRGDERWDAIVIGSGIGGLTAAVLLARYGRRRVLVLERHYTPGGFTHSFSRPGYEWDVGVHYVGRMGPGEPVRRVFDAVTGGRLEWAPMPDVYDRIVLGERCYDLVRGRQRFRERLCGYFPSRAAAIDSYLGLIDRVAGTTTGFYAEKSLPTAIAWLVGRLLRRGLLRHARRTTREVLEQLTSDQELIAVLTGQYGDYGLPPARSSFAIHAIVADHYLEGGYYPVGGASTIAGAAVPEIRQRGGRVLVSAEVERILVDGNRAVGVRMADGRELRAPLVVSDAGALLTYGSLLGETPARIRSLHHRLAGLGSSTAHICLYLGLDRSDRELGLSGTNLWIYEDEKHEQNLERFLRDPQAPIPLTYVSFPSAKDPSWEQRHPGRSTIDVITLANFDWFARWQEAPWRKRGEAYEELKQDFCRRLLRILYRQVPQVEGHVAFMELGTPLSTRNFVRWQRGEIYGLEHTPARFEERGLRPRTPIKGLFLTGQDVSSCGVAGALFGGALTASAILGRPLIPRLLRA